MNETLISKAKRVSYAMKNNLKYLNSGDTFHVTYDKNDIRAYKCINDYTVELIAPSEYQKNSDNSFRDGNWKKTSVFYIEPTWYITRGYMCTQSISDKEKEIMINSDFMYIPKEEI